MQHIPTNKRKKREKKKLNCNIGCCHNHDASHFQFDIIKTALLWHVYFLNFMSTTHSLSQKKEYIFIELFYTMKWCVIYLLCCTHNWREWSTNYLKNIYKMLCNTVADRLVKFALGNVLIDIWLEDGYLRLNMFL